MVLEAAVVSAALFSFLLHPASASAAMASDATPYLDPFIHIVPLPPLISGVKKKSRSICGGIFRFAGESGKNRTRDHYDAGPKSMRLALSPDKVSNLY
jgi:hypothetical protein